MYAIRSKQPDGFRRSGVFFAANQWTLITEPTEAQLHEEALEIVADVQDGDPRLKHFPIQGEETLVSPTFAGVSEENARLRAELETAQSAAADFEAAHAVLTVENATLHSQLAELTSQFAELTGQMAAKTKPSKE